MKTILHISADYPDPLVTAKTGAVANLLAATGGFRHVVYSLDRVSWKTGVRALPFGNGHVALAYGAPPYGVALSHYLERVARWIADDIERRGHEPDLIHAHKFTVEGLIAADVARRLGIPFIASVWGDTDCKIIGVKRRLRGRFQEIAARAKLVLPAAPWTARFMEAALAVPPERMEILPVMTVASAIMPPTVSRAARLVSLFNLNSWRRKGLDVLLGAMRMVAQKNPDIVLDVYGSGSPRAYYDAASTVEQAGLGNTVRLCGALAHEEVQQVMNGYTAFVMAPRRETFGMVHVEAVLAGLPILWARDRGIDGLIDPSVGIACDPNSATEVAAGIEQLVTNEQKLKRNLARLQADGAFRHLQRDGVARQYADILARVTGGREGASRDLLMAAS